MTLLNRLLAPWIDPTFDWKPFQPPIPDIDLTEMRFGPLRFGDSLEEAAILGRPDRFEWQEERYAKLLYARGGFQIDFDEGKFDYLGFFLGPDPYTPKHPSLAFSQPILRGYEGDRLQLNHDTSQDLLEQVFGAPEKAERDSWETIVYYPRRGIMMEFELETQSGKLKRVNLYPE